MRKQFTSKSDVKIAKETHKQNGQEKIHLRTKIT